MNAKKSLTVAAVLAAVLGVAMAAPSFIDWNAYKGAITERAEPLLGRKIALDGDVSAALLPTPHLSLRGVRIANKDGAAQPDMLRLERIDARLDLAALLTGRVGVASLTLVRPELELERFADGGVNWDFTPADRGPATPDTGKAGAPSAARSEPADELRLARIAIEDGVVLFRRPGAEPWRADGINADLSATATGFRLSGSAILNGVALNAEAAAERRLGREPAAVSLALSLPDKAGDIRVNGTLAADFAQFSGKLTARSADVSRLPKAVGRDDFRLPRAPFTLESSLSAEVSGIEAKDMTLGLGGQTVTGSVRVERGDIAKADIFLSAQTLDADSLIALVPPAQPVPAREGEAADGAGERTADSGDSFRLPADLQLTLDANAGFVTWRGGILRGLRFNAQLDKGEIVLHQAAVSLPGDTDIALSGFVSQDENGPLFTGAFDAHTDRLRGLLAWLGVGEDPRMPADRLRALKLSGSVTASRGHAALDGIDIRLDGSRAEASLSWNADTDPRLNLTFGLDLVNADAYWPALARNAQPAPSASVPAAPEPAAPEDRGAGAEKLRAALDGIDAGIRGRIGQIVAHGASVRTITLDARLTGSSLAVRNLSLGDLGGAGLRFSGGIDLTPFAFRESRLEVNAPAMGPLLAMLGVAPPVADPARLGAGRLDAHLNGDLEKLSFDGKGALAGGTFSLSGALGSGSSGPRIDADIDAAHDHLADLVRLFQPGYRPSGTLGPFKFKAHLAGDASAVDVSASALTLGPVTATGSAKIDMLGARPRADIRLSTDRFPVDRFLSATKIAALPPEQSGTGRFIIPARATGATRATGADGMVPILTAAGGEPPKPQSAPRPKVNVSEIAHRWSDTPFDLSWMTAIDATAALTVQHLSYREATLEQAEIDLALADGVMRLDRFVGLFHGGRFDATGRFGADGAASAKASLSGVGMKEALLDLAGIGVADGTGDAALDVRTQGMSQAEMVAGLAGEGRFSVRNGEIDGFDLKAASRQLSAPLRPVGLIGLAEAALGGGRTRFSDLSGSFTAKDGVVTSNDLKLIAEGGSARGQGAVNLPGYVLDARLDFTIDGASEKTPPLTLRINGSLDNPRRRLDIDALQNWLLRRFAGQEEGMGKVKPKQLFKELLRGIR